MNAKARPKVPKWVHRRAVARRWFRDMWRELQSQRAEATGRPMKTGGKPKSDVAAVNPWPRCASCHRRRPASEYGCEEPGHEELCRSCCGCTGDKRGGGGGCSCSGRCDCEARDDELDEDEDEGGEPDEQEPGQGEDGGETNSDDHH